MPSGGIGEVKPVEEGATLLRYSYNVGLFLTQPVLTVDLEAVVAAGKAVWEARYSE